VVKGGVPPEWEALFKRSPGLVLGFHGCDKAVAERVLSGEDQHLKASANDYDWLGGGIYFWESDPWRALEFASNAKDSPHLTKGKITEPYVVGAVISLGLCCNLLESSALDELHKAYEFLGAASEVTGTSLPRNRGRDLGQRYLDRAVIEAMHRLRDKNGLSPYQSVRAAFIEGNSLYEGAGFNARNHIQIAVRDAQCILGYFRLRGL
jgi:hypothetical protein